MKRLYNETTRAIPVIHMPHLEKRGFTTFIRSGGHIKADKVKTIQGYVAVYTGLETEHYLLTPDNYAKLSPL